MSQQTKGRQPPRPVPARPSPGGRSSLEEAEKQRQRAESMEVAGRHKNTGQKDHKGAR
jgi:hypothetical protein